MFGIVEFFWSIWSFWSIWTGFKVVDKTDLEE
jgi:hypothetical protein